MSAEERSAYARQLAARRDPKNMARTKCRRRIGTPNGWTAEGVAAAKASARIQAIEMVERMKAQGLIDPADTLGINATIEALVAVRSPGNRNRRLKAARKLLRFYLAEELVSLV